MVDSSQYQRYKEQAVVTMTPGELIVFLYDEAALNITMAIKHIEQGKVCDAHNSIIKAQNIFLYLKDNLDMSFSISKELSTLYDHIYFTLVEANLKKDAELLKEILKMTNELGSTWKQADQSARSSVHSLGKNI